jgi:hypothetical protein
LPFRSAGYGEPNAVRNAIDYAEHRSRSHDAVIRVYDDAGNVIETHEHVGEFRPKVRTTPTARSSASVLLGHGMNSLSVEEILGFDISPFLAKQQPRRKNR